MAFGLDYVSGPSIDAMKAKNVAFVCRYLSFVNNLTQGKILTLAEAKQLGQANIAIVSNYEWYASRAREGRAAGVQDAQIARDQHAACGGPPDRPIYFSVDEDVTGESVADYFRGVASVIGLARTGAYGSYGVVEYLLNQGLVKWAWQTYAWSHGDWDERAHIRQYQNDMKIGTAAVDFNQSMKPDFGQWIYGGGSMQQYNEKSADFGQWFTATDMSHWTAKGTGKVVQFGIKSFYASLSIDGNTLPIVGLPLTNEINLTVNGKRVVLQVFERAAILYDPDHLKDRQPGTGNCALCHLNDPDLLSHIPGLPTLTPVPAPAAQPVAVDTTALEASIHAIADGIAPLLAAALVEAHKLGG